MLDHRDTYVIMLSQMTSSVPAPLPNPPVPAPPLHFSILIVISTHLMVFLAFNQTQKSFPIKNIHGVIFQPCRVILRGI